MKHWLILAAIAVCMASGAQGYRMGSAANEARHTATALAEAQATAARQQDILTAEVDARQFALAQEDAAHADPDQSPACLSASRVLRLKAYEPKP